MVDDCLAHQVLALDACLLLKACHLMTIFLLLLFNCVRMLEC